MFPVISHPNNKCEKFYFPNEDISNYESLDTLETLSVIHTVPPIPQGIEIWNKN